MSDAALAARAGIPADLLHAIRDVESGGSARAVRFEPHVFHRLTSSRYTAQVPFTPNERGVSTVSSETSRAAFERAANFDREAAIKATSWGRYQVLGGHLLALYPDDPVRTFDTHPAIVSDELLVHWFQQNPQAADAARRYDLVELARRYNGSQRWGRRVARALEALRGPRRPTLVTGILIGGSLAAAVYMVWRLVR